MFTRCRYILKMVKNVTVAKFELAFTRCRNNLKTVRNLKVRKSLQDFDTKKCTFTLRIDQSRSKSFEKFSVFIVFECSHDAVSKMCRLEFCFKIYRFQNRPAKTVPFSCEQESYRKDSYPPHFHRFQNVPVLRSGIV